MPQILFLKSVDRNRPQPTSTDLTRNQPQMYKINQIEGFKPWDLSYEKSVQKTAKGEIESFSERLGVELWRKDCFEIRTLTLHGG